jgi:hypothetical protein
MCALAGAGAARVKGETNVAELQTLLEGVPLPASKRALVAYGREHGGDGGQLAALEELPDDEYVSLDDVAEALRAVQPSAPAVLPPAPRPESGAPPGGTEYEGGG